MFTFILQIHNNKSRCHQYELSKLKNKVLYNAEEHWRILQMSNILNFMSIILDCMFLHKQTFQKVITAMLVQIVHPFCILYLPVGGPYREKIKNIFIA